VLVPCVVSDFSDVITGKFYKICWYYQCSMRSYNHPSAACFCIYTCNNPISCVC